MSSTFLKKVAGGCMLGLLTSCASFQTSSDHAPDANFARRVTFRFLPDRTMEAAGAVSSAAYWHNEIGQDILQNLNQKGYRLFPNRQTDLLIAYHVVIKDHEGITTFNNYSGYDLSADATAKADLAKFQNPQRPGEAAQGVLIIDALDGKTHRLLWRGWATRSLPAAPTTPRLQALLKVVVNSILNAFPSRVH